jgi:hypothetical protein
MLRFGPKGDEWKVLVGGIATARTLVADELRRRAGRASGEQKHREKPFEMASSHDVSGRSMLARQYRDAGCEVEWEGSTGTLIS